MDTIYDRIELKRSELGLSVSQLTENAELSEKYLQQLKRFPDRNVGPAIAKKISAALGVTPQWLLYGDNTSASEIIHTPITPPKISQMSKDIPVVGTAAASHNGGAFQLSDGIIDYVRRPPALENAKDIYALYIEGSSMEPQFWPGDLIFIHPHKPARVSDVVIIQEFKPNDQEITATIGVLKAKSATHIHIHKRNPKANIEVRRENVKEIHKVLSNNELYGI